MNKTQFYRTILAGAVLGLAVAGVVNVTPASAAPTSDCKTVAVNLTNRADTGTGGHVWARNKMTRTMKVCAEAASGDVVAAASRWQYSAVITDAGTFVTQAGKTPRGVAGLPAGVEGTVNGTFKAKFTADSNWSGWTPGDLVNTTPTSGDPTNPGWVKTAFPSAEGDLIFDYHWKYETPCESYADDNDKYTGDIAGKICVATVEFSNATCKDAKAHIKVTNPNAHVTLAVAFNGVGKTIAKSGSVTHDFTSATVVVEARQYRKVFTYEAAKGCPSASPSPSASASVTPTRTPGAGQPTPSQSTSAAGLPVTGPRGIIWVSVAGVLIAAGVAALTATRRRRDRFEA